jgi:carboxymethylenebutenolidase
MSTRFRTVLNTFLFLGTMASQRHADPADAESQTTTFEVMTEPVRYMSGIDTVRGIIFRPSDSGSFPGVVVIHEWWGLNTWVKESAKRIAARGYVALAIDLYRGEVATDAEVAHELMRGVPEDRAARDLQMAVEFLKVQKGVVAQKIGSVGWCMGGGFSLQTALVVPELTACVMCYGRLVTEDATLAQLGASVLGIFGGLDRGIPTESVHKFEAQSRALDKDVTVRVYDSSGHAFMNPNNTRGYTPEATDEAWTEIFEFFDRTLGGP